MRKKNIKIIRWILTGLLSLQFIAAGLSKLNGGWNNQFNHWGYPESFAYVVGIAEILAVAGLYFTRFRNRAAGIISLIMVGAMYTHLMAGEYTRLTHNGVIILVTMVFLRLVKMEKS